MNKLHTIPAVMMVATLALGGCLARGEAPSEASASAPAAPGAGAQDPAAPADATKPASLPSTSRKVIRNAELAIEVKSPAATETKVSHLVERLGGYIHSSQREVVAGEGEPRSTSVTLSLRVPAERLDEALREIKRFGAGDETEKIGAEDVTDEYIDVAARVANQRRLEQQLVGILAQANKVDEALKVHQELNGVRTEIDRLEGRRRFLESEAALAKISLSLQPLRPVVGFSTAAVGVELRHAASDSISVAGGIITFAIRAAGILAPISLLFGLPALGVFWLLKRRQRKLVSVLAA
jgi:hypothetical protein